MGLPAAALLAVAEVESAGRLCANVRGRKEPVIRFEGHYFDRLLTGDKQLAARAEGLADPKAGEVRNPHHQSARWKLLDRAIAIDRLAALSSTSWGVGQVMGVHWKWLGYGSVDALVVEARSGAVGQVAVMVRYIQKAGLVTALKAGDWVTFARVYNGPAYAKLGYDRKIQRAYQRLSKQAAVSQAKLPSAAVDNGDNRLMFGARGAPVRKLQKGLCRWGYILVEDGVFGLITDRVLRRFQADHQLQVTGIVGPAERTLILENQVDTWLGRVKHSPFNGAKRFLTRQVAAGKRHFNRAMRSRLLSIFKRIA